MCTIHWNVQRALSYGGMRDQINKKFKHANIHTRIELCWEVESFRWPVKASRINWFLKWMKQKLHTNFSYLMNWFLLLAIKSKVISANCLHLRNLCAEHMDVTECALHLTVFMIWWFAALPRRKSVGQKTMWERNGSMLRLANASWNVCAKVTFIAENYDARDCRNSNGAIKVAH